MKIYGILPKLTTGDLVGEVHAELALHHQVSVSEEEGEHCILSQQCWLLDLHDLQKPSELHLPPPASAQAALELADRRDL